MIIINLKYIDIRFISFNEICKLIFVDLKFLFVFEFYYGLYCFVVVVDVEDTYYFGFFEVIDFEGDFGDGVVIY